MQKKILFLHPYMVMGGAELLVVVHLDRPALAGLATFASCAATSYCANKVVGRSRLVSLQFVLRRQRLESLEEFLKKRNRK
jgi:hypothetical protein